MREMLTSRRKYEVQYVGKTLASNKRKIFK